MIKKIIRLNSGKVAAVDGKGVIAVPTVHCLTFSSPETFSISVATPSWDGTMEYSSDAETWNTWDGSAVSGTAVYLRGIGNTKVTGGTSTSYKWTLTGSNISCEGNIETLLDHVTVEVGGHPTMASCCYSYMFYGCTALTTAPALPATTLVSYCYNYMFNGCTGLTEAPALPATELAYCCYHGMFYRCTSLTTPPELPATTLAINCYTYMFYGCTNLTTAPALPATALAEGCYYYMFYNCTALKLSSTQTGTYTQAYRIPTSGTGITATNALSNMFIYTGGTFTGTPEINTTYYLDESCSIVS